MSNNTITSRRPCPVCGGRKWVPLSPHDMQEIDDAAGLIYPVIEEQGEPWFFGWQYDRCVRCGTIVAGEC